MKPLERRGPSLAAAGVVAAAVLGFLLTRSAERPPSPLPPPPELAAAPAAPIEPPPPPPPASSADGLKLYGLLGRGAIISPPDGRQRFFAIGREVTPGLRVTRIEQSHVVLASASGELRLGFDGARPAEAPASPATDAIAAPARGEADLREQALSYRFGLAARRSGGRITGYAIRPGASLPLLRRAGLRAGDVLVSVNGQTFDSDEKVLELPGEIAGAFTAEFEFERGGQRMRASLEVNPRS